jgi:hypothetical protein
MQTRCSSITMLCLFVVCNSSVVFSEDRFRDELDKQIALYEEKRDEHNQFCETWFADEIGKARKLKSGNAQTIAALTRELEVFRQTAKLPDNQKLTASAKKLETIRARLIETYRLTADQYSKASLDIESKAILEEMKAFTTKTTAQFIPKFVGENIAGLKRLRPAYLHNNKLNGYLDEVARAAKANDFYAFRKAIATALEQNEKSNSTPSNGRSKKDIATVLIGIRSGMEDFSRVKLEERTGLPMK